MGSQPLDGVGKGNSLFILRIFFKTASLMYSKVCSYFIFELLMPLHYPRRLKGTSE